MEIRITVKVPEGHLVLTEEEAALINGTTIAQFGVDPTLFPGLLSIIEDEVERILEEYRKRVAKAGERIDE